MQKSQKKTTNTPPIPKNQPSKSPHTIGADDTIKNFAQVNFLDVGTNQDGQRLDNFLLARLKGLPRTHLYKLIRDGQIRLNKKRCKPHDRLSTGDVVRIAPIRLSVREAPVISCEFARGLLDRIVFEDEGLMVLNKPHGLAVHGGSGESVGVIEAIRVATGKKYLELVHRIDKDTSGLLMIAKKRSTLKALQDALRQKSLEKSYVCFVAGHITQDKQRIDKPLYKYTLANGERRVKVSPTGKDSQTDITVLARTTINHQKISVVLCQPRTGRTHQIRVHMASLGHPLLGDDKYHPHDKSGVHRLCLHAYHLKITDYPPIMAPLPLDMCALVADILPLPNLPT